ncbi:MAG: poly-beta-1,6-N-acetyl-D-glucosamine biosynthesis protein PgaD [Casimicrobiaceae bacterium]|nr:poly-beta-1,6-N-acetyl-D-glucosamine biosynthesis protein PgaD [Casimicrobiaceae bacterium]
MPRSIAESFVKKKPDLIIDQPSWQTPGQRRAGVIVRVLFWAAYLYLLLPLFTTLVWWVGGTTLRENLLASAAWRQFVAWLPTYAGVVSLLSSLLVVWSLVQIYRFRGRERRRHSPVLTLSEVSRLLGSDEREVARWREARRLVAYHDEQGRVSRFETPGHEPSATLATSAASGKQNNPAATMPGCARSSSLISKPCPM